MNRFIAATELPFPDALKEAAAIESEMEKDNELGPEVFTHIVSSLIVPATGAVFDAAARNIATDRAADAGIACELYRREQGKLPTTLNELVPQYLPSIPIDPFTGQPMIYKVDENGFKIYSLGKNKTDDGGKLDPKPGEDNRIRDEGLFFLTNSQQPRSLSSSRTQSDTDKTHANSPPQPQPRLSPWTIFAFIAALLLLMALSPVALFLVWNARQGQRVKRELEKIETVGEPVTVYDLGKAFPVEPGVEDVTQIWIAGLDPLDTESYKAAADRLPFVGANAPEVKPKLGAPWPEITTPKNSSKNTSSLSTSFTKPRAAAAMANSPSIIRGDLKRSCPTRKRPVPPRDS